MARCCSANTAKVWWPPLATTPKSSSLWFNTPVAYAPFLQGLRVKRFNLRVIFRMLKIIKTSFPVLLGVALMGASMHGVRAQSTLEPTQLLLKIEASAQVNADDTGRPSPIKLRIYELKELASFEEADFFSLQSDDKAALGAALLFRDELTLQPGGTHRIERKSHPDTKALAILAAYRDLSTTWRYTSTLKPAPKAAWYRALIPANKLDLTIKLQHQGIVVIQNP